MPDSAAALSVLVLAWDEAAPTVRAVVEAAPAVGSLLVLLPPALPEPAPAPPIPVAATPAPAEVATSAPELAPAHTLLPAEPASAPSATLARASTMAVATQLAPALTSQPTLPAAAPPTPAVTGGPAKAARPIVRVVHVVASQLPATVRSGSFQVPAAPYLGSSAPVVFPRPAAFPASSFSPATAPFPNAVTASAEGSSADYSLQNNELPTIGTVATALAAAVAASVASSSEPAEVAPPAATAEATALATSASATTPAAPETSVEPLAEAAFAASEILDANPENELQPASEPLPTVVTPADSLQLSDPAPSSAFSALGPFGNRLPQLDTSPLPAPRPVTSTATDDPEDTPEERARVFAASVAAAQQYTAPDLNSQVIRYARLAVPLALAEGAYEVIYAPAWPTWLAALELRQRTLGPLVLHLPALAAGRQPADTAAGWPAELQRQALRQADLVLVETYALARRLRRELGLGPATVRVVPTADAAAVARALRRARRRPGLA